MECKINTLNDILLDYNKEEKRVILLKNRNVIVRDIKEMNNLIQEAIETKENKSLHLGKISEQTIKSIKSKIRNLPKDKKDILGKDSYDLVINQSEIRHLFSDKNMLMIDEIFNFIILLPLIIGECDSVFYTKNNKNEGLKFKKYFEDGTYFSFMIVSNKKRTLLAKSIFMLKKAYENKKRSVSLSKDA